MWLQEQQRLSIACLCRFEEPDAGGSKSFFTEIIASVSDIKFAKEGRYLLSRDYMTLKVHTFVFSIGIRLWLALKAKVPWTNTWLCFFFFAFSVMGHQHGFRSVINFPSSWISETEGKLHILSESCIWWAGA